MLYICRTLGFPSQPEFPYIKIQVITVTTTNILLLYFFFKSFLVAYCFVLCRCTGFFLLRFLRSSFLVLCHFITICLGVDVSLFVMLEICCAFSICGFIFSQFRKILGHYLFQYSFLLFPLSLTSRTLIRCMLSLILPSMSFNPSFIFSICCTPSWLISSDITSRSLILSLAEFIVFNRFTELLISRSKAIGPKSFIWY